MADFKCIDPTPETVKTLQTALNEADYRAQGAEEKINAATHAIKLMLKGPDSGGQRLRIKTLCELIENQSFDVMNTINSLAEKAGAHYVDEISRKEEELMHAAAR